MRLRRVAATAAFISILSVPAFAADDFSIAGTYVQNAKCKGDGTDAPAKVVRITEVDVHSSFGVCVFESKTHEGNTLAAHMSCDGPNGHILLGDVKFTVRDDKNVDFTDQDGTVKVLLYKCPQADTSGQAPATTKR